MGEHQPHTILIERHGLVDESICKFLACLELFAGPKEGNLGIHLGAVHCRMLDDADEAKTRRS
jgi:hypothetical protein